MTKKIFVVASGMISYLYHKIHMTCKSSSSSAILRFYL